MVSIAVDLPPPLPRRTEDLSPVMPESARPPTPPSSVKRSAASVASSTSTNAKRRELDKLLLEVQKRELAAKRALEDAELLKRQMLLEQESIASKRAQGIDSASQSVASGRSSCYRATRRTDKAIAHDNSPVPENAIQQRSISPYRRPTATPGDLPQSSQQLATEPLLPLQDNILNLSQISGIRPVSTRPHSPYDVREGDSVRSPNTASVIDGLKKQLQQQHADEMMAREKMHYQDKNLQSAQIR